jgi:hypothetical protein
VEAARERAEAAIALATEHGFYQYLVAGMLLRGCALVDGGQIEAGITEMRGALDLMRAGVPSCSGHTTPASLLRHTERPGSRRRDSP